MLRKFKKILSTHFGGLERKNVYLAISGGKDSICLSHLLLSSGIAHTLLHCNFQLRGNESDLDASFLVNYAAKNKLQLQVKKFDTQTFAKKENLTIQEAARKLRYDWFNEFIHSEKDVLLTAHHEDDATETFFINLMRGTTLQGLTGIRAVNGAILRPLLFFTAEEIENYISKNAIPFRQDQSNFDNKYLRNQLRNLLIPEMERMSPNFKSKVAKTIMSLKESNEWIEQQATKFKSKNFILKNGVISFNKGLILSEEDVFIIYVFRDFGIHRSNIQSFKKFIAGNTGGRFCTETHEFHNDRTTVDMIGLDHLSNITQSSCKIGWYEQSDLPQIVQLFSTELKLELTDRQLSHSNPQIQQLNASQIKFPISIRKWKNGDKIQPLGMKGSKLISDILIDKKISMLIKKSTYVVIDTDDQVLCIVGMLISDKLKISDQTTTVLRISH